MRSFILWSLIIIFTAGAIFLTVCSFYFLGRLPLWSAPGPVGKWYGLDFINYWAAPRIAHAQIEHLFSLVHYNEAINQLCPDVNVKIVWSYPLHTLLFLWPFSLLAIYPAYLLWTLLGLTLYGALACYGVERNRYVVVWFAIFSPASLITAFSGQIVFFTTGLFLGAFLLLSRNPKIAGVLLGILTIKPQWGLVWPILLLKQRRFKTIGVAIGVTLLLFAMVCFIYGPHAWEGFLHFTLPFQWSLLETPPETRGFQTMTITLPIALQRIGLSSAVAFHMQWLLVIIVSAVLWCRFNKPFTQATRALLLCCASMLLSPYLLTYDMVLLTIPLLWCFAQHPKPTWIQYILWGTAYILPALNFYFYFFFPITPFVLLLLFLHTAWSSEPDSSDLQTQHEI